MQEIEILVKVYDCFEYTKSILDKFKFVGLKETNDDYYYDPLRENLKPDSNMQLHECFRLRNKGEYNYLTYKIDHFNEDNQWIYSDEYETKIESHSILENIVEKLGLKKLITINSKKYTYVTEDYEIVLENVENLGVFLEVEFKNEEKSNAVNSIKTGIQNFIDSLNIKVSKELNMGKPEMMIRKINGEEI